MNHTKEPWYVVPVDDMYEIHSDSADVVWSIDSIANAQRIVACVNACADVEDKKLKLGYVKELEAENAELHKILLQNGYNAKLREDV